jgi:sulfite dehydrogenase (cytochrome) subunit B
MKRFTIAAGAALLALATAGASPAQQPGAAKVSITLPGEVGFAFKPGAGVAVAESRCLECHSSAYVSTQPVLSKVQWTAEVAKMRKAYGAPLTDDEAATVVDYVTAAYGKP